MTACHFSGTQFGSAAALRLNQGAPASNNSPPEDKGRSGGGTPGTKAQHAVSPARVQPGGTLLPRQRNVQLAGTVGLLTIAALLLGRHPDLANPLIIAAEVSLVIAITLILYSQNTNPTAKSGLNEARLVLKRGERSQQARKARTTDAMCASIERLLHYSSLLAEMGGRYAMVPEPKRPQFWEDLEALHRNVAVHAGELERMLESADCPDDRTRDDILTAIDLLRGAPLMDYGKGTIDTAQYRAISRSLGPALTRLKRSLEPAVGRPFRRAGPVGEPGGLALCLDRHTYPPGTPICATVEADGQFPHHKVTVTILDEDLDALDKKTKCAPMSEPGRRATIVVDMNPKKIDIGHEYIARATCGDLYDEAVFAVENVAPIVRTDRTTCAIGDIIAVTVEDPAAGEGGAEKGPFGTAGGQRLVIESPHDRNDACHLRAAEALTGTFLGRVRCVGACGAASSGRRAWAWGEGAEDVDIACGPDQLIRIRYESEAGEARTAVLVDEPSAHSSAFGAGAASAGGGCSAGGGGAGRRGAKPEPGGPERAWPAACGAVPWAGGGRRR